MLMPLTLDVVRAAEDRITSSLKAKILHSLEWMEIVLNCMGCARLRL